MKQNWIKLFMRSVSLTVVIAMMSTVAFANEFEETITEETITEETITEETITEETITEETITEESYTHEQIMDLLKNEDNATSESINEYEMLKEINQEYQKDFSNGLSDKYNTLTREGLNAVIHYQEDYANKIYDLQNWSDEKLEFVGYDDLQINAIRNFDGSEEMMAKAATTVTVNAGFRNKKYTSSGGTTVDLIVAFNSKGIQSNWWNDLFCVVWSNPLTVSSNEGYIEYRDTYYMKSETKDYTPKSSGLYARQIEFPKYLSNAKYVFAGSMVLHLKSNAKVVDFAGYAAYGYSSLAIQGVGVSYPGGLTINFGTGMKNAGSAYAKL